MESCFNNIAITFEWMLHKFIWNLFQLNKTFLIDINKYFQRFKDALITVQIQMKNFSKIFIIDDQPLVKFCQWLKIC